MPRIPRGQQAGLVSYAAAEKLGRSPSTALRTNGGVLISLGISVHAKVLEAFRSFFSSLLCDQRGANAMKLVTVCDDFPRLSDITITNSAALDNNEPLKVDHP